MTRLTCFLNHLLPREEAARLHMPMSAPIPNAWQYLCIPHLLEAQAKRIPDALALLSPERVPVTYSRLWRHVNGVARTLHSLGISRHDRVALVLPNGLEMAAAFLGVAASATCAPLNPDYSAHEFAFYLKDLRARALILKSGMDSPARAVARAHDICVLDLSPQPDAEIGCFTLTGEKQPCGLSQGGVQPNDVALVAYSTGTTSRPKKVALTHANLCISAYNTSVALSLSEDDRCLNVMPLFHLHALDTALLASLAAGASVVCTPGLDAPQFFSWLAEFRPTWYTAHPTIHQTILSHAAVNHATIMNCPLRFIRSSSAALPRWVLTELERVFDTPVLEGYGLTETASQVTCNPLPPHPRKTGSVGVAAGVEVAIMDERGTLLPAGTSGEIVVRGGSVMQCYDNDPTASRNTFTDGWFRTGDQGYLDADGYLFITGRLKELINRGGEKIAPREVEDVLMDHPAVAQAVTFAIPDVRLGENVGAAVMLRRGASVTESDIRNFAAARLAPFKVPCRVLIVEDLPKGSTGKLQRLGLAEKLGLTTSVQAQPSAGADNVAPRTPVEEELARIWAQVLNIEHLSIHDDFFRLGGDSLQATQMMSRVRNAFQVELPLRSLFETPTIAMMAEHVETALWVIDNLQISSANVGDNREDIEF
jgi:acyl-CoA synthetase (AMP-forming)/AMP-acid ligase II/acyl carrier protein